MKIKILEIYELNDILRIETECEFGKDNLGLSLQKKYNNPATGEPRWKAEVKSLLEAKYTQKLAKKKEVFKEFKGKEMDLDKINIE